MHLAIAPLLAGQPEAARFLGAAGYPGGSAARMKVLEVRAIDMLF
ncbi:hypothetical protein ABZ504_55255 [Streptomyces mirabilis]